MSIITTLSAIYLKSSSRQGPLRTMIFLCYAGIIIGTSALSITLFVMRGFERDISHKMQSINSDATINSYGKPLAYTPLKNYIMKKQSATVAAVAPRTRTHLILTHKQRTEPLLAIGILPHQERLVSSLPHKIIAPYAAQLPALINPEHGIIIGQSLAQRHHIKLGDTITLQLPSGQTAQRIRLHQITGVVTGVFRVGLEEYDQHVIYVHHNLLKKWHHDTLGDELRGCTELAVRFRPTSQFGHSLQKLKTTLSGLSVRGWHEKYPEIIDSLTLEKYVMSLILALIILVASMNMVSLLFMLIYRKRRDIAILRALGTPWKDIQKLFLKISMRITVQASCIGLFIGTSVGYWLEYYRPIQLPSVYFVSYLPAAVEWHAIACIFCGTLALSFIASKLALRGITSITIDTLLRKS